TSDDYFFRPQSMLPGVHPGARLATTRVGAGAPLCIRAISGDLLFGTHSLNPYLRAPLPKLVPSQHVSTIRGVFQSIISGAPRTFFASRSTKNASPNAFPVTHR